ncbi:HDOD domain-containing protein [Chitinimonas lacunae]|uniref:HDOD domain-containing protein n=1 Tax=Chitinimonas lacunae TaxID=1963018 RepID=A0ABV8MPL1_9NEIS
MGELLGIVALDKSGETRRGHMADGRPVLLVAAPWLLGRTIEAQAAGHASLTPLLGTAEHDGESWLVYEWREGERLLDRLAGRPLPVREAVLLLLRLLDGVVHAMLTGTRCGPLLPERILLGEDESLLAAAVVPAGAPYVEARRAAGELLYELLTGMAPQPNERGEILLPANPDIDVGLEALVLGALGESGAPRLATVLDLRGALVDYRDQRYGPDRSGPAGGSLARLDDNDDFPALSRAISAIGRITELDGERLQVLATVILHDFSLTNKVLRLANSASYGQFGGTISTVSRAIMVLGFETIKSIALSLVFIEQLHDRAQAEQLKDEVAQAFLIGLVARLLAMRCNYPSQEEARIVGLMHPLGRLTALFFFHDEMAEIARRVASGEAESAAARQVLGSSFEELGVAVAHEWHLPDKFVVSLGLEPNPPRKPRHDADWLRLFANAASTLTEAALGEPAALGQQLIQVRQHYGAALGLRETDLHAILETAARACLREAEIFGLNLRPDGILIRLRRFLGERPPAEGTTPEPATPEPAQPVPQDRPEQVEALSNCIQEVTEALVADFHLDDLLYVIVETLYRQLEAEQALIAVLNPRRHALVGRFGFGDRIEQLLPQFVVPLGGSEDIFGETLAHNRDLLLDDIESAPPLVRIPAWYRKLGASRSLMLWPLVVDRRVVGLIYVGAAVGRLRLGPRTRRLCHTLRNQAVLAIRQKLPPA